MNYKIKQKELNDKANEATKVGKPLVCCECGATSFVVLRNKETGKVFRQTVRLVKSARGGYQCADTKFCNFYKGVAKV